MTEETAAPEGVTEESAAPVEGAATEQKPAETPTTDKPEGEKPEGEKKVSAIDRRIAQLTARLANEAAERQRGARELEALRAMLAAKEGGEKAPEPPAQPEDRQAAIRAEAERIVAQQRMQEATNSWLKAGYSDFGKEEFDAKSGVLAQLGATEKQGFLEALVGLENGHKVVPMLADDQDEAMRILELPPLRMAAELGKLAAKASIPAPKPSVSKAPPPNAPVKGGAKRDWALTDPDIPMDVWVKLREKQIKERGR